METKKPFLTKKELIITLIITAVLVAILVPTLIAVSHEVLLNEYAHFIRPVLNAFTEDRGMAIPSGTSVYYIKNGAAYHGFFTDKSLRALSEIPMPTVDTDAMTITVDGVTYPYEATRDPGIFLVFPTEEEK